MSGKIDWDALKTEYVAGSMSQRDLADAHGLDNREKRELRERAGREKWYGLRKEAGKKTAKELVNAISDAKIKKVGRIIDLLLSKTEQAARQLNKRPVMIRDQETLENGTVRVTVRTKLEDSEIINTADLRILSQTIKDLDESMRRQRQEAAGNTREELHVIFDPFTEDEE